MDNHAASWRQVFPDMPPGTPTDREGGCGRGAFGIRKGTLIAQSVISTCLDIPLAAFTAIYAPESGTVLSYAPSATDWEPGQLLLHLDGGGVIGFGHVNDVILPGTQVHGGEQIATVGNNGSNSHVEFMYSPTGAYANRSDFTAYPLSDPQSPMSLLQGYMSSRGQPAFIPLSSHRSPRTTVTPISPQRLCAQAAPRRHRALLFTLTRAAWPRR
jgi:hypothetical protein